jgi:hypothetical protein
MDFTEVHPDQFHFIGKDETITRFPLVNAVVSRVQMGHVYTNRLGDLFIIHKGGFSRFVPSGNSRHEDQFISLLENTDNIPQYFHLYDPPQPLTDAIEKRNDLFNIKLRKRIQLRHQSVEQMEVMDESNFRVERIDESNFERANELGIDLGNKFWNSREDFLKNGLGVCVLDDHGIALSACYSACLVDGVAEIDIVTHPNHRKLGLGQLVTKKFITLAMQKKIISNWDCFEENSGSLSIAKNAKFNEIYRYQFLSVFNKRLNK